MPKWVKRTLVVLITVFTFGIVTPPSILSIQDSNPNNSQKPNVVNSRNDHSFVNEIVYEKSDPRITSSDFVKKTIAHAENVSFEKFGPRIGTKIEDEFKDAILPKIEEVIAKLSTEYKGEKLQYLAVTEHPSGGVGERIFNIYDNASGKDLIRFHVRRDKLPLEGYWFNFHYHTHHDAFQSHHTLGSIYWDKNTPPKWLS